MDKPQKYRLTIGGLLLLVALSALAITAFRPSVTKIDDIKVGVGPPVKTGDTVTVHYVGRLKNGKVFDSSKTNGQPFDFQVGKGVVIKGWDIGLVGMQVGGVRQLTIPPDQAYGDRAMGPLIPPNSTLVFDIELLKVQ